jgi:hypothetical protein
MESIIAARFGQGDPRLAAINEGNRTHYREQQIKLKPLYAKRHILTSAYRRILDATLLLQIANAPELGLERLRCTRSFEQEVFEISDILSNSSFAKAQGRRASGFRVKIGPDRTPVRNVIQDLIFRPEYRAMPASELWPHIFSEFKTLECEPKLIRREPRNMRTETIWFKYFKLGAAQPTSKKMSFRRFENLISELRTESQ